MEVRENLHEEPEEESSDKHADKHPSEVPCAASASHGVGSLLSGQLFFLLVKLVQVICIELALPSSLACMSQWAKFSARGGGCRRTCKIAEFWTGRLRETWTRTWRRSRGSLAPPAAL